MNVRRQAIRDQILRTAVDLFRERGYRASTLDDIARRLGMSKASLYGYFRAKDEMLAAISRETIEGFTRELGLVLRSSLSPEDKLRRVVRQHVRFVIANRSFLTVFFSEEASLPARFARQLAAMLQTAKVDLVVLAVEWGSGRRRGTLSNLHLGARDTERGGFVMLGKTFKGLTDAMLAWQTKALLELEISRDAHIVYVRPELVVEVAFSDVQESPQYPAGMALRFARVKRYREDKTAGEADTIETVRKIFEGERG